MCALDGQMSEILPRILPLQWQLLFYAVLELIIYKHFSPFGIDVSIMNLYVEG